ncbi:MAG: segregation/condensation protein A [Clostridia bacterium]|nr:segregation/condensation protein A [Clostridia bacterium]
MDYKVTLNQFEGPLDLLLHLIEKAELNIEDIFLSEITSQYLSYMDELDERDMERCTEFLTVAAQLVLIKSRQLLPRPPVLEAEEEDMEQSLIRQLREYKQFKEAGEELRQMLDEARKAYSRLPEDVPLPPQKVEMEQVGIEVLYEAFLNLMQRSKELAREDKSQKIVQDIYTIRRQINIVREKLKSGSALFSELFSEGAGKLEMIVTFMAILELLNHGEIRLSQKKPFAPIKISVRELHEDDEDYTYMDELEE